MSNTTENTTGKVTQTPTPGMVKWVQASKAAYTALATKDANSLYFIIDTGELYKGSVSFSDAVVNLNPNYADAKAVANFAAPGQMPENPVEGRIYIYPQLVTVAGASTPITQTAVYTYQGGNWITLVEPLATTITDANATFTTPASSKAVVDYVLDKFTSAVNNGIQSIAYDEASKSLNYVTGDSKNHNVAIDGFITDASYTNGALTFNVQGGDAITLNLPKDNFVTSGSYDSKSKSIVLELRSGEQVIIPAADLVNVYTGATGKSANVTVTGEVISVAVNLSKTAGNSLVLNDDGLFVPTVDTSNFLSKVATGNAGNFVTANADGTVAASNYQMGGATISSTPNSNTAATEAAVSAVQTALNSAIGTKVAKSSVVTSLTGAQAGQVAGIEVAQGLNTAIEAVKTSKVNTSDVISSGAMLPVPGLATAEQKKAWNSFVEGLTANNVLGAQYGLETITTLNTCIDMIDQNITGMQGSMVTKPSGYAQANQILVSGKTANEMVASNFVFGGATIDPQNANAKNTLATEAGVTSSLSTVSAEVANVLNMLSGIQTSVANKIDKFAASVPANQVVVTNGEGGIQNTGMSIGTASFNTPAAATTLATEAGVLAQVSTLNTAINGKVSTSNVSQTIAGSETSAQQVASVAAVVNALTWVVLE